MSKSILQNKSRGCCYICENYLDDDSPKMYREKHHVFGGPLRKKSEHFGLTVYLCRKHHTGDINGCREAVHRPDLNDYGIRLKKEAQAAFERKYGHEVFMREFGKNYMEET